MKPLAVLLSPACLAVCLALWLAVPGQAPAAAAEKVDVELVLAADGSGSIDDIEFALQRKGFARAISHPLVLNAIRGGEHRKIAVLFVEWGAPESVETIVDWTVIGDAASAKAFAERLVAAPRQVFGYNSISAAIAFSTQQILSNRYDGKQKIIDISGDGPQINGPPLQVVRAAALNAGITINGLAIKTRTGTSFRSSFGVPLEVHYRQEVIGGPGAFVMTADENTPFEEVILSKLVREIAMLRKR
ncbi:MAG: DUF1194 domain-containing protein [Rhodospirillaceae bacterium]|nr:DUF1194 domain-containing protein [Rhodospirillaceae bacterium]